MWFNCQVVGEFKILFYFWSNFIMVIAHTLWDFNYFKFGMFYKPRFGLLYTICPCKECVLRLWWWSIVYMSVRDGWWLFRFSWTLVFWFHLLRKEDWSVQLEVGLVHFSFQFCPFCFMRFEALLLGAYIFMAVMSLGWVNIL